MRGICTICTDFFEKDQDISATHCGHAFHEPCLSRWLKQCGRNWTCPHCRTTQTQKQIVWKLYFDVPETDGNELDPYLLKNQLDQCQSKEQKLRSDKKMLKTSVNQTRQENENLTAVMKTMQKDLKEAKYSSEFLKDQLKMAKDAEGELIQSQNEAKRLRERLKTCEKMEFILEGQKSQVDQMIQQYNSGSNVTSSVKQLTTFCAALKQEYENLKTSRNKANEEIMKTKREIHKLNQQLVEKNTVCEQLQENISAMQRTEEQLLDENESLRRKLQALQSALSSPSDTRASALSRLLLECPAPVSMTPDVAFKNDVKHKKRISSGTDAGSSGDFKKPKLSPSTESSDIIDLSSEESCGGLDGSYIGEPITGNAEHKKVAPMREKTNTESPGTLQTKKLCEEMGLKYVKTTSSIKNSAAVKMEISKENCFQKPKIFPTSQPNGFAFRRTNQANKYIFSGRTNKVPMSAKAKPFTAKALPTSSLRPKFNLLKKSVRR